MTSGLSLSVDFNVDLQYDDYVNIIQVGTLEKESYSQVTKPRLFEENRCESWDQRVSDFTCRRFLKPFRCCTSAGRMCICTLTSCLGFSFSFCLFSHSLKETHTSFSFPLKPVKFWSYYFWKLYIGPLAFRGPVSPLAEISFRTLFHVSSISPSSFFSFPFHFACSTSSNNLCLEGHWIDSLFSYRIEGSKSFSLRIPWPLASVPLTQILWLIWFPRPAGGLFFRSPGPRLITGFLNRHEAIPGNPAFRLKIGLQARTFSSLSSFLTFPGRG